MAAPMREQKQLRRQTSIEGRAHISAAPRERSTLRLRPAAPAVGESARPAYDFGRIPVLPAPAGVIQPELLAGGARPAEAPPVVHEALSAPGQPLEQSTRSFMEERFGHDFGRVRVHTGEQAASAASAVGAHAFTVAADIVFGQDQYAPATAEGRRLIAHELTHVVQQQPSAGRAPAGALSIGASAPRVSRAPVNADTQDLHEQLVEQYRLENGYPPHGIDPTTGAQVGPTDAEIRFGGLLDAWLRSRAPSQPQAPGTTTAPTQTPPTQTTPAQTPPAQAPPVRGVPAPAQAPAITPRGTTRVTGACSTAQDRGACLQHQTYITNVLPQAVANIRAVSSPYSAAIADLYAAVLPSMSSAPAPVPTGSAAAPHGQSVNVPSPGPITVRFGSTNFTFTRFTVTLLQQMNGANGQAFGIGGPIAFINLNEISNDALLGNLANIEATMIHETMHIFNSIVEAQNAGRQSGTPAAEPNLDRTSYAALQTTLEAALLPFVRQVRQLPGVTSQLTEQRDVSMTAESFLSEAIARAEAGIFQKQRSGQAFTAADLRALPAFFHAGDYWSPDAPASFIQANQSQIDAAIQPIIHQVGEMYLNLRP